jgi:hypothetical protein
MSADVWSRRDPGDFARGRRRRRRPVGERDRGSAVGRIRFLQRQPLDFGFIAADIDSDWPTQSVTDAAPCRSRAARQGRSFSGRLRCTAGRTASGRSRTATPTRHPAAAGDGRAGVARLGVRMPWPAGVYLRRDCPWRLRATRIVSGLNLEFAERAVV